MSFVIATPEIVAAAAAQLGTVGSALNEANGLAALKTVALPPAAADEVSTSIAHLFSRYAQDYHAAAGQAAAYGEQFAESLKAGSACYASAEASILGALRATNSNPQHVANTAAMGGVYYPGVALSPTTLFISVLLNAIFSAFYSTFFGIATRLLSQLLEGIRI